MLKFITGSVLSGKTMLLLEIISLVDPDARWILQRDFPNHNGEFKIQSRARFTEEVNPDEIVTEDMNLFEKFKKLEHKNKIKAVFCDEIQFFTRKHIDQLTKINQEYGVKIYVCGISETHDNNTWDTIKYLNDKLHSTIRIQSKCHYCSKPAETNIRADLNQKTQLIDTVNDGESEKYYGSCLECHDTLYKK
ncbi:thymidine kinase [Vairimorpha necatrix]|uniref:thymidine kinase n=1 Tax=Vairimorpha necatrix TaxID=6039 RepID=A0AAX4JBQ9_9MICR